MFCRELFEQSDHSSRLPHLSRSANVPSSQLPTPNSSPSHLYHSKHFINSFVSHTCGSLRPQTLSFDRHPFLAGGGVGYQTGYPSAANSAFCLPVSPLDKPLTDTFSRKSFRYVSYAKRWGGRGWQSSPLRPIDPSSRSFYHAGCGAICAFPGWSYVHA